MNILNQLGLEIHISNWKHNDEIPIYINNIYTIQKAHIQGVECLMLTVNNELPSLPTLKKQILKIQEIEPLNIFLKLNYITQFRKESLIENKISFIISDKEVFLPFLATYLSRNKNIMTQDIEKFSISTQLLFIWILYQKENKYFIMNAVHDLPFTNMTLTRAYRQLVQINLFKKHKEGRKIYLTTQYTKKELFYKAKKYFYSPIIKSGYIYKKDYNDNMIKSGICALSDISMLNPPTIPTYAIYEKHNYAFHIENELIYPNEQIELEIWNYDPLLFSQNKKQIDTLSLIISLSSYEDERIEIEIDNLLDKIL